MAWRSRSRLYDARRVRRNSCNSYRPRGSGASREPALNAFQALVIATSNCDRPSKAVRPKSTVAKAQLVFRETFRLSQAQLHWSAHSLLNVIPFPWRCVFRVRARAHTPTNMTERFPLDLDLIQCSPSLFKQCRPISHLTPTAQHRGSSHLTSDPHYTRPLSLSTNVQVQTFMS